MKIVIALCALSALLASCTSATRMRMYDRAYLDTLAAKPVDIAAYDAKYSEYDGVYLLSDRYYEHSGGAKMDAVYFSQVNTLRYIVLNPHADNLTTFSLDVDKDYHIEGLGIVVRSPDGATQFFGADDMRQTRSESGTRSYKLALPDVKKGTVVTTMYGIATSSLENTFEDDVALQFSLPCEQMEFRYAYPTWWAIDVKKTSADFDERVFDVRADEEHHKNVRSYVAADVPAYRDEIYTPYIKDSAPYCKYRLRMVTGAQIIYGMRSWYEMASELRWYASNSTTFWNAEAANRTDTILANCRTKRQKLDTVLAYIQKNINWGGSSVRPDAATMLRKGEGNALTMSALARAMMREGGIDVQLVMMHSADDGYFDERFVAPSELYMPGVIATIDSTEYTMLPYYKGLSPNLLPDRFKNTDAMKVTEAGTQEFTSTPAGSPETNKRSDAYNIAIGDDGALKVEQDIELVGEMAYLKRREIEDLDPARLKAEMKDVLDYSDGDILDFTYEVVNRDDYGLPLTIRLRYTIDNLVTVTPDEVVFQTGGLFSPASRNKNKVDVDKRESPIRVYGDETLDKRITIHFPASWKLATKLPNVEKSNMYGEVKGSYALSDGMLDVTHHRVLRRGTSGPEKFSDLLAIIGTRSVLNVPSLVFKRSTE